MSGQQLSSLAATGSSATGRPSSPVVTVYSPPAGTITALNVKEGNYVQEGALIIKLADLSALWAEAQVYSSQLSELDPDAMARVEISDFPRKTITGRTGFINPRRKMLTLPESAVLRSEFVFRKGANPMAVHH